MSILELSQHGVDLAQREVALARIRTLLAEPATTEDQCKADIKLLLAGLAQPFAAVSAETVARTVTNIGVALSQGIIPHELHFKVIALLIDWMENEKGIPVMWRSHIALRLGATVFLGKTDSAHCDEIAQHLIAFAARAVAEDDLLEHAVEMLFTATWESTVLDTMYLQTLCTSMFRYMNSDQLSITMRGRMLHAAANTLAKRHIPTELADELILYILDAMPALCYANSPHYSLLAWSLSDAAARDLAKNVPMAALEHLAADPSVDEEYRAQISQNISIVQVMTALSTMITDEGTDENRLFLENLEIDERLIQGLS